MSTTVAFDMTYDAPLAAVTSMLADPAFREAVCDAQHATSRSVSISGIPGTVDVSFTQRTEGVPSFAKKFVGDSTRAITTQVWTGTEASYVVDTPGKPTSMKGTASIAENGSGSTLTYDLEVKASVPLVGGKLEDLIAGFVGKAFDAELKVGVKWLRGEWRL